MNCKFSDNDIVLEPVSILEEQFIIHVLQMPKDGSLSVCVRKDKLEGNGIAKLVISAIPKRMRNALEGRSGENTDDRSI